MAPSHPLALLPDPHEGAVGWEALKGGECMSDPQSGGTKDAPRIQAELEGVEPPTLGLLQLPEPWARNCPHSGLRNSHRWGLGGGCIHASGH